MLMVIAVVRYLPVSSPSWSWRLTQMRLMFREDVLLYPVNPKQLASYRDSYHGGGKNDPTDAMYLARMLRERITTLKAWQPDDKNTRLIANLSQQRRKIVDGQTKLRQQLTAVLKSVVPNRYSFRRFRPAGRKYHDRCLDFGQPPTFARRLVRSRGAFHGSGVVREAVVARRPIFL